MTGLVFGSVPALRASKPDLVDGLREEGPTGAAGSGSGHDDAVQDVSFSTERRIFDAIRQFLRFTDLGDQLEIVDTRANGDLQLVTIDDASEIDPLDLATLGFRQKVIVLGEESSLKLRGSIEQLGIR